VDDDVTLKSGDILHVGQSELLVEISKWSYVWLFAFII